MEQRVHLKGTLNAKSVTKAVFALKAKEIFSVIENNNLINYIY
jgi:hypothetical protein